jgi:hypothetical protein
MSAQETVADYYCQFDATMLNSAVRSTKQVTNLRLVLRYKGFLQLMLHLCYCTQLYETFTDFCTHLERLFVAVGSAELSTSMALYTMDQKLFAFKS